MLEDYQRELAVNTLYKIRRLDSRSAHHVPIRDRLYIKGGVVNIYGGEELPASVDDMDLDKENFSGYDVFDTMPVYLYCEEVNTVTKIIITGVDPEVVDFAV